VQKPIFKNRQISLAYVDEQFESSSAYACPEIGVKMASVPWAEPKHAHPAHA
jgi:hypothetical protein